MAADDDVGKPPSRGKVAVSVPTGCSPHLTYRGDDVVGRRRMAPRGERERTSPLNTQRVEALRKLRGALRETPVPRGNGSLGDPDREPFDPSGRHHPSTGEDHRTNRCGAVEAPAQDEVRQKCVARSPARTASPSHEDRMDDTGLSDLTRIRSVEGGGSRAIWTVASRRASPPPERGIVCHRHLTRPRD